jgi:hypothetical protein
VLLAATFYNVDARSPIISNHGWGREKKFKRRCHFGLIVLKNSGFDSDRRNSSPHRPTSSWRRGVRPNWSFAAHAPVFFGSRTISSDFLILWAFARKSRCQNFRVFQHNGLKPAVRCLTYESPQWAGCVVLQTQPISTRTREIRNGIFCWNRRIVAILCALHC